MSAESASSRIIRARGEPKKVAFPPNCSVRSHLLVGVDGARNDFGHTCDTQKGSSGAPLLDVKTGLVLGLHHWDVDPRVTKLEDQENQAIHIDLIADHLRMLWANDHGSVPKTVIDQVLQAKP